MAHCKVNSCYSSTNYYWEDYCSYHQRCLSKLQEYKSISNIQEIETFDTWFNGNCGYVINYDSSASSYPYYIWIVVYEPKQWNKEISESLSAMKYDNYSSLSSARDKAQSLRDNLKYSDNPILYARLNNNSHESFSNIVTGPYVIKRDLPCSWGMATNSFSSLFSPSSFAFATGRKGPTREPDKYLKPLDIVKSYMPGYYHVGVYLGRIDGEYKVCHFTKEFNGTRIHSWEEFIEGNINGEVIRYHPVIPFKNYSKIAQQIAWAENVNFRGGNYDLNSRNCEHFANMIVYGINHSEQIEKREKESGFPLSSHWAAMGIVPNYNIKLTDEINTANNKLGCITNSCSNDIETSYLQEVPPKQNCQIM